MIEIIDDYLPQTDADRIERLFLKDYSLPWFVADGMTHFHENNNPLRYETKILYHHFYRSQNHTSQFLKYITSTFKFDYKKCLNIRANLTMSNRFDLRHSRYHTDWENYKNYKTYIYYVNGFNTPTILKTGLLSRKLVFPKKNRMLIFDGNIEHANYIPFFKERCVINFNFKHERDQHIL